MRTLANCVRTTPDQTMAEIYKPKQNPWFIAVAASLATIMEVLDTSIANVALPHIAGSLGASETEATWVITSYLVANAIVLPIGAYLGSIVGRKRFYMICVMIFGLSSLFCGLAPSLPLLLFFRVVQGLGGGGLQPSSQSILVDAFPQEQRGQAIAVYGIAAVTAPIIGPTLGGWITDSFSWRWCFFINIPIAVISLMLTNLLVEDPPAIKQAVSEAKKGGVKIDFTGFLLIALTFGCLEVVLDKGQEDDWFSSHFITSFSVIAVVAFIGLIGWELWQIHKQHRPILDLRVFAHQNFCMAFALMFALGFMMYACTVLLPQLLQTLMGYTAGLAGMAMSAGGLATLICMPIAAYLVGKIDGRYVIISGLLCLVFSLYHMTALNLQMSFSYVALLRFYQSLGLSPIFVTLNVFAYVGVEEGKSSDIAGLMNLAKNLGGSCGTSFFATMLARHSQIHQQFLVKHVYNGAAPWDRKYQALTHQAFVHMPSRIDAQHHALARFYQIVHQQAALLSYLDIIQSLIVIITCTIPLVLLMKKSPKAVQAGAH
jgi:DHA2 family multidrug resistance protein